MTWRGPGRRGEVWGDPGRGGAHSPCCSNIAPGLWGHNALPQCLGQQPQHTLATGHDNQLLDDLGATPHTSVTTSHWYTALGTQWAGEPHHSKDAGHPTPCL